jgi:hypothetical protein
VHCVEEGAQLLLRAAFDDIDVDQGHLRDPSGRAASWSETSGERPAPAR